MSQPNEHAITAEIETEVKQLIAAGRTVAAIKRLMELSGLGLANAKKWVENNMAVVPIRKTWAGKPCPYCGKPLRTDMAKQCSECGADWHDENNVIRPAN